MSVIVRLIANFLRERPWQFALAVTLCALGLASAVGIVWLQSVLESHARRQAEGIDIVVGAKGSALQNVLTAVYYLDAVSYTHLDVYKRQAVSRPRLVGRAHTGAPCGQHGRT